MSARMFDRFFLSAFFNFFRYLVLPNFYLGNLLTFGSTSLIAFIIELNKRFTNDLELDRDSDLDKSKLNS
jgi:hypothetical protein